MLQNTERAKAGRPIKNPSSDTRNLDKNPSSDTRNLSTLHDLSISYDQSSLWQRLAECEMAKPPGSNQHEDRSPDVTDPQTLEQLGISRDDSSQWPLQSLAQTVARRPIVAAAARSGFSPQPNDSGPRSSSSRRR